MDFWRTLQVLRRRWYVLGPALLISAVLTVLTFASIPTRYESTGVLVLTSPSTGAKFSEGTRPEDIVHVNPLLAFDGSLTTTAQILAQILRDPATAEALGAGKGTDKTYTITNGELNGPFVFVTTETDSAQASQALVGAILDRARSELNTRQRALDAPESTFIQPELLVKPTDPDAKIGGKIRFTGAALILALIFSLAATYAAESVAQNRRRVLEPPAGTAPNPHFRSGRSRGPQLGRQEPSIPLPEGGRTDERLVVQAAASGASGQPHAMAMPDTSGVATMEVGVNGATVKHTPASPATAPPSTSLGTADSAVGPAAPTRRRPRPRLDRADSPAPAPVEPASESSAEAKPADGG